MGLLSVIVVFLVILIHFAAFYNHLTEVHNLNCILPCVRLCASVCARARACVCVPHGAMGWSMICDWGISGSYLLVFVTEVGNF